ncbi:hypothetical protein SH661x_003764 [Planctomicrobium sp. SH661]|uniref:hypothetical protein n=1 Tax=Planctomicrobium sp. SH661 TaxID=3448124 RepID=UPI003F5B0A6B
MRRPLACGFGMMAGLCLTLSSGCYHMYSQPYGYSGAPAGAVYPGTMQYPAAPIQTLTPGQPYTPGATYQAVPQGTTPTYNSGTLQPIPDNSNSAPSYGTPTNPGSNTSPTTPDPYFNNTNLMPQPGMNSIQPTGYSEPAPLHPPAAGLREVRSMPTDFVPEVGQASPTPTVKSDMAAPTPAAGLMPLSPTTPPPVEAFAPPVMSPPPGKTADPFASGSASSSAIPPLEATPAGATSLWDVETKKVVTADVSAFGHDPKFQWLRGVVSKEPEQGTWSIVYNDAPNQEDQWAGHLSLAPSPHLERLRDGDVVEIQGQIDNVVRDQLGKPVYLVSSLKKPFDSK